MAAAKQIHNRKPQTTSLEDRLQTFAVDARAAAEKAPNGRERENLLARARKAEAMADASGRLKE